MFGINLLRSKALLLAACGTLALQSGQVHAQSGRAVVYSIEAQDLGSALTELAKQSGREIYFSSDLTRGKRVQGLKGNLALERALDQLLDGTGLGYRLSDNGAITIAQASVDTTAPVAVIGSVVDGKTGANLKGARVRLEGTELATNTDDLGGFRFPGVKPGEYKLWISYLGYGDTVVPFVVQPGRQYEQKIVIDSSEIVVVGRTLSARAQALNQERTADNFKTVVSSDLLGNFNATTVSDALRRAAGVAFVPDAQTGEGTNVIIRGQVPDLNQVTLNGVRIAEGSGAGRAPDLSSILTESIEKVTINKTLLASQDSTGSGGLVEIETKSPLDRPRRYASFSAERGWKGGDYGKDTLISGTLSASFGQDNSVGVSLSAQYREQDSVAHRYNASLVREGLILPEGAGGIGSVDPRLLFPYVDGFDQLPVGNVSTGTTESSDKNFTITGSLQKKFGSHTDIRLDVVHSDTTSNSFFSSAGYSNGGNYVLLPVPELNGAERAVYVSEDPTEFNPGISFGGDRSFGYTPGEKAQSTTISLNGTTVVDNWTFQYTGGYALSKTRTPLSASLTLRSNPALFLNPDNGTSLDPNLLTDAVRNRTIGGRVISIFPFRAPGDRSFVFPSFNAQGLALLAAGDQSLIDGANIERDQSGSNERYSASGSVRRDFSSIGWLDYVEAGFAYDRSVFGSIPSPLSGSFYTINDPDNFGSPFTVAPVTGLGISFVQSPLVALGATGAPTLADPRSSQGFENGLPALVDRGLLFLTELDGSLAESLFDNTEQELSYYLQTKLDIGKFEIIGGVRVSNVKTNTEFFVNSTVFDVNGNLDEAASRAASLRLGAKVKQTDILPRVLVNFRASDKMTFRAGYFSTFARPQVQNLVAFGGATLNLQPNNGPNGDRPVLSVNQGNPDLKPAFTQNFDLSWEWYTGTLGALKASVFYKTTKNFLEGVRAQGTTDIIPEGVVLPNTPAFNNLPDNILIDVVQTRNSDGKADLWGFELSVERQFTFLPGFLKNFGIFANYTYADSSRDERFQFNDPDNNFELTDVIFENQPFSGTAKHSGTASLTYSSKGLDANLTYTRQSRRLSAFAPNGLSAYNEAVQTLDFRSQYTLPLGGVDVRVFFEGRNLLQGTNDPFLGETYGGADGVPKYFTGGIYQGGRQFRIGVNASF